MLFSKLYHLTDLQSSSSNISVPISLHDVSPRIALAIENEELWDFDIFELEAATQHRCVELVSQGPDREPPGQHMCAELFLEWDSGRGRSSGASSCPEPAGPRQSLPSRDGRFFMTKVPNFSSMW